MIRAVARRREGFVHEVEIDGGAHTLIVDEPLEAGGTDAGPSPTRVLAASLAACTAITMQMYAERKGWSLEGSEVEVKVAYDGPAPSAFEVILRLPAALSDEQRRKLEVIAGKCPVHRAIGDESVVVTERMETV